METYPYHMGLLMLTMHVFDKVTRIPLMLLARCAEMTLDKQGRAKLHQ